MISRLLIGKPEEQRPPQRPKCGQKDDIKNNAKNVIFDFILVAQNGVQWRAIVDRIPLTLKILN